MVVVFLKCIRIHQYEHEVYSTVVVDFTNNASVIDVTVVVAVGHCRCRGCGCGAVAVVVVVVVVVLVVVVLLLGRLTSPPRRPARGRLRCRQTHSL